MGKFRRASSRASVRGGGFRSRFLTIAVAAFVGVNLFLLLRSSIVAHEAVTGGEGGHRYRQTEQVDNERAVLLEQPDGGSGGSSLSAGTTAAAASATTSSTAGTAVQTAGSGDSCHTEAEAEYEGEDVVAWGDKNMQDSPEDCCKSCQEAAPRCNVWVYCGKAEGCAVGRAHRECWLKRKRNLDPITPKARRAPGSGWVSGAVYTEAEKEAAIKAIQSQRQAEENYLEGLRSNESLPLVYLDVEIKKKPVGRIEMVLFSDVSPRAAENFRQLCTGESGSVPNEPGREGAGRKRHFKGAFFYRIIDQFIDQTGVETESVFGGQFKDDPGGLKLKHERKGLLSMANMGHDTNTAHFSIMMGPAHHLDGDYTIFGQVVRGFDVVDAINALSKGKPDNTATPADGAQIVDSGQIRKGTIVPDLNLGL